MSIWVPLDRAEIDRLAIALRESLERPQSHESEIKRLMRRYQVQKVGSAYRLIDDHQTDYWVLRSGSRWIARTRSGDGKWVEPYRGKTMTDVIKQIAGEE